MLSIILLVLSLTNAAARSVTCSDPSLAGVPCLDAGTTGPKIPGGGKPPQFVMITHDDAIDSHVFDQISKIDRKGAPITFYALQSGSDCSYVKALHDCGDEIALHSVHHAHSTGLPESEMRRDLVEGVRTFFDEECGIPSGDMIGFRAPFLEENEVVRRSIFSDDKIRYDATFHDYYSSKYSKDSANRLWPYTQHDPEGPFKNASVGSVESYPGRWSLPILNTQGYSSTTGEPDPKGHGWTTDPSKFQTAGGETGFGGSELALEVMKKNFDDSYNGNRAPIGVYTHITWFDQPGMTDALNEFITYVLEHEDARFVTATQLVNWLEHPTPASSTPKTSSTEKCPSSAAPAPSPSRHTPSNEEYIYQDEPLVSSSESEETSGGSNAKYWLAPLIMVGPVIVITAAVSFVSSIQRCMRRRKTLVSAVEEKERTDV